MVNNCLLILTATVLFFLSENGEEKELPLQKLHLKMDQVSVTSNSTVSAHQVEWVNDEILGECARFNGSDSRIEIDSLQPGNSMTLSLWFRPFALTNLNAALAGFPNYFWLRTTTNREIQFTQPGKSDHNSQELMLSLDQWYHLAARIDRGMITVFINGMVTIHEKWIETGAAASSHLFLGQDSWQEHFNGLISQFSYWDCSLTDEQLKQLYQQEHPQIPIYSGVIAYLPFSGNANSLGKHPQNTKNITYTMDSIRGEVACFDGQSSFTEYGPIPIDNVVTISAWINPCRLAGNNGALVSSGQAYAFRFTRAGKLLFTIPQVIDLKTEDGIIVPGKWQHVAATYHEGKKIALFKNGEKVGSWNYPQYQYAEKSLRIGNNLWNNFYDGFMDDVIIWNRILSEKEIEQVYLTSEKRWSELLPYRKTQWSGTLIWIGAFITVLSALFYFWKRQKAPAPDRDHEAEHLSPVMAKARSIAVQNISNSEFTVEHFAEAMHMSRTKLYNELKAHAGMSPKEYIRDVRINLAASYLTETDKTVTDIGFETGFESRAYFNKCFKNKFKQTPSEYRKKNNHLKH